MKTLCAFYNESAVFAGNNDMSPWLSAFKALCPQLTVVDWKEIENPEDVVYGIVWQPNKAFFQRFPNIVSVFNLGAGVDGILNNSALPDKVGVYRIEDAGMAQQMNEYFAYHVLHYHRHMHLYQNQQRQAVWASHASKPASDYRVGILGLGVLGTSVANHFKLLGYSVSGWSRQLKQLDGITCYAGMQAFNSFLENVDALCCLLPLTTSTMDILNYQTMQQLPQGAVIINAARGEHLVEQDLLTLLDEEHLAGAVLDTFRQEPLPTDNPLWQHPKVMVTPHCSAQSLVKESVLYIGNNIQSLAEGKSVSGLVDRAIGY